MGWGLRRAPGTVPRHRLGAGRAFPPVVSRQIARKCAAPDGTRITRDETSLELGKLADFVLFDRDFSRASVGAIHEAKVRLTVVGGRLAYE